MADALSLQDLVRTTVLIARPFGVLHISGESRLDLIDRLSTQKVKGLPAGSGAATIFTTDIGRMIDRVLLYAGEEQVIALTGEGYGDPLARYLMSYVFFGDDFHLVDRSAETAVLAVYGAPGGALLRAAGLPAAEDLPRHHWRAAALDVDGEPTAVTLHRTDPLGGDGWLLLVPSAAAEVVSQMLAAAGAEPIDGDLFDRLRIAAGLPRFGAEVSQDYIPLEAGLWEDVSFNKGCYVGQEIIARLESRGKLAKQLVRLHTATPLTAGTPLEAGGKPAGTVTSAAGQYALAYVKTAVLRAETPLTAGGVEVEVLSPES